MLATMTAMNPLDSLLARLRSIASGEDSPGYGTATLSPDGAEIEYTMRRDKINGRYEPLADFVARVARYTAIEDVTWSFQDREIVTGRFTRRAR